MPLAKSWLDLALAHRLGFAATIGGALLGVNQLDCRAGPLLVGPLG
jgi:hypothetical protein